MRKNDSCPAFDGTLQNPDACGQSWRQRCSGFSPENNPLKRTETVDKRINQGVLTHGEMVDLDL